MPPDYSSRSTAAMPVVRGADTGDAPSSPPLRATGLVPIVPAAAGATRGGVTANARATRNVTVAQTSLIRIDHYADIIATDSKALRRSLPDVAAEALALCTGTKADANIMERTLSRDPFMSAQVISIANSAMFAPRMPIHGVRDAVVRIGLDAVRDVVLMVVTNSTMFRVRGFEARVESMRRCTLAAAAAARLLARELRVESEYGFLAGLLHDIGEMILLERCVQEGIVTPALLDDPVEGPPARERLDFHHTRVGGALCRAWKLPSGVIEAAEYHHNYKAEDGKTRFAAHLCAAADAIAAAVMPGGHAQLAAEAPPLVELGITSEKAATIIQQVTVALPMLVSASGTGASTTTGVFPVR